MDEEKRVINWEKVFIVLGAAIFLLIIFFFIFKSISLSPSKIPENKSSQISINEDTGKKYIKCVNGNYDDECLKYRCRIKNNMVARDSSFDEMCNMD